MTPEAQRMAILTALGYERIELDYETHTAEPGLTQGSDGIWRTPSANKWDRQIREQGVGCVGVYFVRLSDGQIFADFDGPDTGDNGRGSFDYLHDLNEVQQAFMELGSQQKFTCVAHVVNLLKSGQFLFEATASQWCEGILRTIGKWEDSK